MVASPRVLTITLALIAFVIVLAVYGLGSLAIAVWRLLTS